MNVKFTGVREIDEVLKGLPRQVNDRLLRRAHTLAAAPLVLKEKQTAPRFKTRNLKESIGIIKASRNKELGAIAVGPRRKGIYKGHAAHLVEYGTKKRSLIGKGKYKTGNRGVMPAKPFAFPAWQATRAQVLAGINGELGRTLLAYMKRTIKKAGK